MTETGTKGIHIYCTGNHFFENHWFYLSIFISKNCHSIWELKSMWQICLFLCFYPTVQNQQNVKVKGNPGIIQIYGHMSIKTYWWQLGWSDLNHTRNVWISWRSYAWGSDNLQTKEKLERRCLTLDIDTYCYCNQDKPEISLTIVKIQFQRAIMFILFLEKKKKLHKKPVLLIVCIVQTYLIVLLIHAFICYEHKM